MVTLTPSSSYLLPPFHIRTSHSSRTPSEADDIKEQTMHTKMKKSKIILKRMMDEIKKKGTLTLSAIVWCSELRIGDGEDRRAHSPLRRRLFYQTIREMQRMTRALLRFQGCNGRNWRIGFGRSHGEDLAYLAGLAIWDERQNSFFLNAFCELLSLLFKLLLTYFHFIYKVRLKPHELTF